MSQHAVGQSVVHTPIVLWTQRLGL